MKIKNENKFLGLAKLESEYDGKKCYGVWQNQNKSSLGSFQIQWLFIKNLWFDEIDEEVLEDKCLEFYYNLEIMNKRTANQILRKFMTSSLDFEKSIFYFFNLLDQRED